MDMWKKRNIVLLVVILLGVMVANAQEKVIITGVVFCEDSIMGTLPDVSVFNSGSGTGTISSPSGRFTILMGKNDTIIFSTVQHMDELFFFGKNESFENRTVMVPMKMDTVYMDVVSVIGKGNYEAFKQELMALKLPDHQPSVTLPIVNRYAEEYSTGEAAIKIRGPLTYLSNKIRLMKRRGAIANQK